jgi:hypothetical protein
MCAGSSDTDGKMWVQPFLHAACAVAEALDVVLFYFRDLRCR